MIERASERERSERGGGEEREREKECVEETRIEAVQKSASKAPLCTEVDTVFFFSSVQCVCMCVYLRYLLACTPVSLYALVHV
jgi:hypothetical protein